MALKNRAIQALHDFSVPVSYLANELRSDRSRDSRNVFSNQGRCESRFGTSRFNSTTLGGAILSTSFFKTTAGTRYYLAKVGSIIYTVPTSGGPTAVKTSLTSTTKYRAKTANNRHLIACTDGLFFFDGTSFGNLGQAVPAAVSVAAAAAGSLADKTWNVACTFYSTTTGFETNIGTASSNQATSGGNNTVAVTSIPTTATNPTIDKVRIYIKNVTDAGSYLYVDEITIGTATYNITDEPTSTTTPPTTHGQPTSGGWKFIDEFNGQVVVANGSFANDVEFSEQYLPDAWNQVTASRKVLHISGDGDISGIAVGFFNNGKLDPYLVIFKKTNCHIYSEIDDLRRLDQIHDKVGCVCADTIQVINGDIYFLSANGWRVIKDGKLVSKKLKGSPTATPITLADGDIDDIFKTTGFIYEVNRSAFENFFSVYYHTLDQYFTFVAESGSTNILKAYVYEFETGGFKPYEWTISMKCATNAEDSSGDEIILFGDAVGYLYKHSIKETRSTDVDTSNASISVPCFTHQFWMDGNDFDATYNFRELITRAIQGDENPINVYAWTDFNYSRVSTDTLTFGDESGFILDESSLDVDIFTDERDINVARMDINRCGENLLLGFYQDIAGANMNLMTAQVNFSKNGNRNL